MTSILKASGNKLRWPFMVMLAVAFIAIMFVLGWLMYAKAAVSSEVNFQGKLTDINGVNVSDGKYDFRVRIYDAATSGTPQVISGGNSYIDVNDVPVQNGIFNLKFSPLASGLSAGTERYLLVCFNTSSISLVTADDGYTGSNDGSGDCAVSSNDVYDKAFTPRKKLNSNPFAILAQYLGSNFVKGETGTDSGAITFTGTTGVGVSGSSAGRIYYDSGAQKFKCSENGAAYVNCITSATSYTIGTIDSQTKSANGAVISGTSLVLQSADASNPGLVTTSTQTIAGAKTFSSTPTFSTMTSGSVLFAGTSGLLSQDNSNLFWDSTNARLGIGTNTPYTQLVVPGKLPSAAAGSVSTGTAPQDVYVQGRYAYVINGTTPVLQIFDVSNPSSPVSVGSVSTGTGPTGLTVSGRYAYVVNSSSNTLQIFDVSNASSPTSVGSTSSGLSAPYSVTVQGRYAYVANSGSNTLKIFDISNPASPTSVGSISTSSSGPYSVYVSGRYVYVSGASVQIFDISNPSSPSLSSTTALGGSYDIAWGVTVQNNYLYVLERGSSISTLDILHIYEISNPASPTSAGTYTLLGPLNSPRRLQVQGKYIYIPGANSYGNLTQVLNISNPSSITSFGTIPISAPPSVYVQGRFLYAVTSSDTLQTFDLGGSYIQQLEAGGTETGTLSVRTNAQIGNQLDVKGGIGVGNGGIYTSGNVATDGQIKIGLLSDYVGSSAPSVSASTTGRIYYDSSGNKFKCSENGSSYFNCFSSANVSTIGTIDSQTKSANGAVISGTSLVLQSADASNPGLVTTSTQTIAGAKTFSSTPTFSTMTSGSVLFAGTSGLLSQDNSNLFWDSTNARLGIGTNTPYTQLVVPGKLPSAATGSVSTGTAPQGLYVQGRYAYVINGTTPVLQIFDISNSSTPVSVGSVSTGGNPISIFVDGQYAYVTNAGSDTMQIYDVSKPSAPVSVGSVSTGASSTPYGVFVQGKYAYVTCNAASLMKIIDVSNPASPSIVGSVATSAGPFGVYVLGRYAYVVSPDGTNFRVYDVSSPFAPTSVGSVSTGVGSYPYSVSVQGRYAYVANFEANGTVQVLDISTPTAPSIVGTLTTGNYIYSMSVQGRYAYAVNYSSTNLLRVIDISTPTSPTSVGTVATGTGPIGVVVSGRYAYVTNTTSNTLQIFDVGGSYIQQLEAGGTETGTLSVRTNAQIGNQLDVKGGINVGNGGIYTSGGLSSADLNITQIARSGTITPGILYTGASHTALTASTEAFDINFNLARTVQFSTGALTTQRAINIAAPTYSFVASSTITNGTTFNVTGAPIGGTNATITNSAAIRVQAGALTGVTNGYGLYADAPSGATNNYGGTFATGNVGVGTVTPGAKLDISNSTASQPALKATQSTNAFTGSTSGVVTITSSVADTGRSLVDLTTTSATANYSGAMIYAVSSATSQDGATGTNTNVAGLFLQTTDADTITALVRNNSSAITFTNIGTAGAQGDPGVLTIESNGGTTTAYNLITAYNSVTRSDAAAVFRVRADGNVYGEAAFNATGADYAEYFHQEIAHDLQANESVCLNTKGNVERCSNLTSSNVIGIVSTDPGFVGNKNLGESDLQYSVLVGLIGQLNGKVDPSTSPITSGDIITASSNGTIKKLTTNGFALGRALESWDGKSSTLKVYVNPFYYNYDSTLSGTTNANWTDVSGVLTTNKNVKINGDLTANNITINALLTASNATINDLKVDHLRINQTLPIGDATISNVKYSPTSTGTKIFTINNKNVTANSKIFVTLTSSNGKNIRVVSKSAGTSFDVKVEVIDLTEISFDYWIVGE